MVVRRRIPIDDLSGGHARDGERDVDHVDDIQKQHHDSTGSHPW
jgi:hypothetical protein